MSKFLEVIKVAVVIRSEDSDAIKEELIKFLREQMMEWYANHDEVLACEPDVN